MRFTHIRNERICARPLGGQLVQLTRAIRVEAAETEKTSVSCFERIRHVIFGEIVFLASPASKAWLNTFGSDDFRAQTRVAENLRRLHASMIFPHAFIAEGCPVIDSTVLHFVYGR